MPSPRRGTAEGKAEGGEMSRFIMLTDGDGAKCIVDADEISSVFDPRGTVKELDPCRSIITYKNNTEPCSLPGAKAIRIWAVTESVEEIWAMLNTNVTV